MKTIERFGGSDDDRMEQSHFGRLIADRFGKILFMGLRDSLIEMDPPSVFPQLGFARWCEKLYHGVMNINLITL